MVNDPGMMRSRLVLAAFLMLAWNVFFALPSPALAAGEESGFDDFKMEEEGDNSEDAPEFGAPARELPSDARVEDIVEPSADYHYAGFGKADPFQPPVAIKAIIPDSVEIPIVSPLQRYPLKDLKLVGVWARSARDRKALLMTPNMEGIIVRVGDLAGNGGGKVMSIDDGSVVVREFLIANDGTRQFSDVRIMFEVGKPAAQGPPTGGAIVIAPGAAKPEVQLPAGQATQAPAGPPPANQTPANLLPAGNAGTNGAGNAAPNTGGNAAPNAGGGRPVQPAGAQPAQQGSGPNFNF